jgi:hypothetical protein
VFRRTKDASYHFVVLPLAKVYHHAPAEIVVFVDHMNQAAGIYEINDMFGLRYDRGHLIAQAFYLLTQVVVVGYFIFSLELYRIVFELQFVELLTE